MWKRPGCCESPSLEFVWWLAAVIRLHKRWYRDLLSSDVSGPEIVGTEENMKVEGGDFLRSSLSASTFKEGISFLRKTSQWSFTNWHNIARVVRLLKSGYLSLNLTGQFRNGKGALCIKSYTLSLAFLKSQASVQQWPSKDNVMNVIYTASLAARLFIYLSGKATDFRQKDPLSKNPPEETSSWIVTI